MSTQKILYRLTLEISYNPDTSEILFRDKVVAHWNDSANTDYPEDLTWNRDISSLFIAGFEAGFNAAREYPEK